MLDTVYYALVLHYTTTIANVILYSPTYAGDLQLWKLPSKYTILYLNLSLIHISEPTRPY